MKVNEKLVIIFRLGKGLDWEICSPILFNLVADMLATLVDRAKTNGQFKGLVPNLVDEGLSILQYVDDTILLMENNVEDARNLKLVLGAFEKLSGLKINFHKRELFCFGNVR